MIKKNVEMCRKDTLDYVKEDINKYKMYINENNNKKEEEYSHNNNNHHHHYHHNNMLKDDTSNYNHVQYFHGEKKEIICFINKSKIHFNNYKKK